MNPIIQKIESKLIKEHNPYRVGDTIKASLKVVEGSKERIQVFEGVIIAINGVGLSKSITVRKISFGTGVERIIPVNSPKLASINVVKKGRPRRAKLYYLRGREGKSALKIKG